MRRLTLVDLLSTVMSTQDLKEQLIAPVGSLSNQMKSHRHIPRMPSRQTRLGVLLVIMAIFAPLVYFHPDVRAHIYAVEPSATCIQTEEFDWFKASSPILVCHINCS